MAVVSWWGGIAFIQVLVHIPDIDPFLKLHMVALSEGLILGISCRRREAGSERERESLEQLKRERERMSQHEEVGVVSESLLAMSGRVSMALSCGLGGEPPNCLEGSQYRCADNSHGHICALSSAQWIRALSGGVSLSAFLACVRSVRTLHSLEVSSPLMGCFPRHFQRGSGPWRRIRRNGLLRRENSALRMGNAPLTPWCWLAFQSAA